MKSKLILFLVLSVMISSASAQNLLDMSGWKVGNGSTTGFGQNGPTSENVREWGIGPHGERAVLWKAIPDASSGPDGGWATALVTIDHTKMYRFSLWLKKTGSINGSSYLGTGTGSSTHVTRLDGTPEANPYFWYGDLPELNKWFLVVGFIHGSGDNSTVNYGGIYDGVSGAKYDILWDFKFQVTTTQVLHRTYLYYNTDINNRQYFYAPRVDEVNGNEPSITELLGISPSNPDQLMVGTSTLPSGYTLSVGGDAIMEKVKVQVETAWPDYVFDKDYPLKSIEELKKYISENGHLPGLPSATEVKVSNQDLGLIQQKLLEKIEELTLYTITQEKKIKESEAGRQKLAELVSKLVTQNSQLVKRIEKLESTSNDNK